jgi:hypothetical protein
MISKKLYGTWFLEGERGSHYSHMSPLGKSEKLQSGHSRAFPLAATGTLSLGGSHFLVSFPTGAHGVEGNSCQRKVPGCSKCKRQLSLQLVIGSSGLLGFFLFPERPVLDRQVGDPGPSQGPGSLL